MPTMSSFARSLNSRLSMLVNSPPKTRCSNCLRGWLDIFDLSPSAETDAPALHEVDHLLMARAPGRDQSRVHRFGSIIDQSLADQGRQPAAGLVHQEIGRREVPVMTVVGRNRRIERALSDAREAQRERGDPRG